MLTDPDMTEGAWRMKKAAAVELENKLDGTDSGDGRVESGVGGRKVANG